MMAMAFTLQLSVLLISLFLELSPKVKTGPLATLILCAVSILSLARMGQPVDAAEVAMTVAVFAGLASYLVGSLAPTPSLFSIESHSGEAFGAQITPDRRRRDRRRTERRHGHSPSIVNRRKQETRLSRHDECQGVFR